MQKLRINDLHQTHTWMILGFLCFSLFHPAIASEASPFVMEHSGPTVVIDDIDSRPTFGSVKWELSYIGDLANNFSGGIKRGGSYVGLAAARAYIDPEKTLGWKGGDLFLHVQGLHGTVPSQFSGDAQIASSIESYTDSIRLMEAWVRQEIPSKEYTLLFGRLDLNAEFYVTESSLLFLNSSFGLGTEVAQMNFNGRTASTFPVTSTAVLLKIEPSKFWYFDLAGFEALPGSSLNSRGEKDRYNTSKKGHLLMSEFGIRGRTETGRASSKLALGIWGYDKPFDHIHDLDSNGDSRSARSYGSYIIGEKKLSPALWAFLRFGTASEAAHRFQNNYAGGITIKGPFPQRQKDELGFGITTVTTSEHYRRKQKRDGGASEYAETAVELTYRISVTDEVTLQPDLQYISHPNLDPEIEDALVGFLRLQIDFGKL